MEHAGRQGPVQDDQPERPADPADQGEADVEIPPMPNSRGTMPGSSNDSMPTGEPTPTMPSPSRERVAAEDAEENKRGGKFQTVGEEEDNNAGVDVDFDYDPNMYSPTSPANSNSSEAARGGSRMEEADTLQSLSEALIPRMDIGKNLHNIEELRTQF